MERTIILVHLEEGTLQSQVPSLDAQHGHDLIR